jgi:hypothetical protein
MKYAMRALGWLVYVLWLVIIVFTATALYSAFQMHVDFGEPQTSTSGGTINTSQTFSIENNGFYEIYNLNLTTVIQELTGTPVSRDSTVVRMIPSGRRIDSAHNVSFSLNDITSAGLSNLLFNDTNLEIEMSVALSYADTIPFKISTNYTMPWGAPLYHITIGDASINPQNAADARVILPFSFENHSFFDLNGTMHTEIINTLNQRVGTSTTSINAPPQSGYSTHLEFLVPLGSASTLKEAQIYFNTSVLSYGPVVIPLA